MKDPLDLGGRVRVEESFMPKRDDRFRFSGVEVAARIGLHAVGSCMHWYGVFLTYDAMNGKCRWNRRQGHQRRTVGGERAN